MSKLIAKIVRNAMASNSCRIGSREVLKDINNAKLIICSRSVSRDVVERLRSNGNSSAYIYNIDKNSMELGRLCGKPFRISIISVMDVSKEDLDALIAEANTQGR
ncbi:MULTISPECIES: ribosomal L7Ae/L30e/S12e/Gadd45 family protein [Candidatus Nitrosocaldus]|jgi:large subunit ribosomal protein L30e|uniref:50S ribosomal protein L30e n=1 Tax=Candidatus Nitrosocaldus cavascurensis TaxID=2058097 RepID=A0A2K5ASR4_9ARCH|nr:MULTISPECIES: ribosomal L7Ae/L30e/S12e/Gadd45 family protein [Candidatus Nitrosocaldus]SPC34659.1 50S ribosomal protein L30e [Candidatus Nitrosocaldus cavascurensis]